MLPDQAVPTLGTGAVEAEVERALVTMGSEPLVKVLTAAAADTTLVVVVAAPETQDLAVTTAHQQNMVTVVTGQSALLSQPAPRLLILLARWITHSSISAVAAVTDLTRSGPLQEVEVAAVMVATTTRQARQAQHSPEAEAAVAAATAVQLEVTVVLASSSCVCRQLYTAGHTLDLT